MQLGSSAFANDATIPRRFTCDGEDLSPPLDWTGTPAETHSLVLLCDDPDAPAGTWHHWAAYDIATDRAGVCTENLKFDHSGDEVRQGWRVNE